MVCEMVPGLTLESNRKSPRIEAVNYHEMLHTLEEDRSALIARAKLLVESGALLTPHAARDTARAMLGY